MLPINKSLHVCNFIHHELHSALKTNAQTFVVIIDKSSREALQGLNRPLSSIDWKQHILVQCNRKAEGGWIVATLEGKEKEVQEAFFSKGIDVQVVALTAEEYAELIAKVERLFQRVVIEPEKEKEIVATTTKVDMSRSAPSEERVHLSSSSATALMKLKLGFQDVLRRITEKWLEKVEEEKEIDKTEVLRANRLKKALKNDIQKQELTAEEAMRQEIKPSSSKI